jgi:hypothetical protein
MEDGKKSGVIRRRLYCSFKQHHLRLVCDENGNSMLDTISHLATKLKTIVGLKTKTKDAVKSAAANCSLSGDFYSQV